MVGLRDNGSWKSTRVAKNRMSDKRDRKGEGQVTPEILG